MAFVQTCQNGTTPEMNLRIQYLIKFIFILGAQQSFGCLVETFRALHYLACVERDRSS